MALVTAVLWRRLDEPGHVTGALEERAEGWRLSGTAAFRQASGMAVLAYRVDCDRAWQTLSGEVRGFLGDRPVDLRIRRLGNRWHLGHEPVEGLDDLIDLDLGFTPLTNTIAIRRAGLADGASARLPAAWLNLESLSLERLDQSYERRAPDMYWYSAPAFDYVALLEVSTDGLVRRYPGLFEVESIASSA
jgi:uncharacterized protein